MITILLLSVALATVPVDLPDAPSGDDLDGLVAYALFHQPALAAAAATRRAASAQVAGAGSLSDPRLMWGEMIEPVETRVGPQQRVISLQQSVPWPGTLGARRSAASSRADAAGAREQEVVVQVAAAVRRAWARAAWLAETRRVVALQIELARSLEAVVRADYEAGQGRYGDLLQAQVEIARLEDRLVGLDDRDDAARAALNEALGRDPAAALAMPTRLRSAGVGGQPADVVHPRLEVLTHRTAAALAEAEAARRAGRPGFVLGVDWIQVGDARMDGVAGDGRDALVARVGLNLPIWRGKHDGAVAAAEARAAATKAERRAQDLMLASRRVAAAVDRRDAARRETLYRDDLLPRARQAYEILLAAYRAGGGVFADVLAAQRTLLQLDHDLLDARRDVQLALADQEVAAGARLSDVPDSERNRP